MGEIDKNLDNILEVEGVLVEESTQEIIQYDETEEMLSPPVPVVDKPQPSNSRDIEFDYETSRTTQRDLLEVGQEALTDLLKVAKESQHPRAYEVASGLIRNLSDMSERLLDLHKRKAELDAKTGGSPNQITNIDKAVFVGSTADLLKRIKKA